MKRKYHTYKLLRAAGDLETLQVPIAWSADEVADKYRYSEVFMWLPKGWDVWGDENNNNIQGPCWVYWHRPSHAYFKVLEPVDETRASSIILDVINRRAFRPV